MAETDLSIEGSPVGSVWDGITRSRTLHRAAAETRKRLADFAKLYKWDRVLRLIAESPDLINTSRLDGHSLYAPLHQAAHGGAPVDVVAALLEFGAWRTLRTARGERPVEIAVRRNIINLIPVLEPLYVREVSMRTLKAIQGSFHEVIRKRMHEFEVKERLRLPELEPMLETRAPFWFPVPGMYGGFSYSLEGEGENIMLSSSSWCRVVGGSGQRHEVTVSGNRLVEEGFV